MYQSWLETVESDTAVHTTHFVLFRP